MTKEALIRSYKSFITQLFVVGNEKDISGLYTFVYAITDYIISKYGNTFWDSVDAQDIVNTYSKIAKISLQEKTLRIKALLKLIESYPGTFSLIRGNKIVDFLKMQIDKNVEYINCYKTFNHEKPHKSIYAIFKEKDEWQKIEKIDVAYEKLTKCNDSIDKNEFKIKDFLILMIDKVPMYLGFSDANRIMNFFLGHLKDFENLDNINEVLDKTDCNNQFINREGGERYMGEREIINQYCKKYFNKEVKPFTSKMKTQTSIQITE